MTVHKYGWSQMKNSFVKDLLDRYISLIFYDINEGQEKENLLQLDLQISNELNINH
jgi:hypothetical protein